MIYIQMIFVLLALVNFFDLIHIYTFIGHELADNMSDYTRSEILDILLISVVLLYPQSTPLKKIL